MLFQDWSGIIRTIVVGVLAYIALVALVRVSGKRTLSKMNAFDLIVTIALGSTLATVLLSQDVALAEGVTGFAVLIGLQLAVTWLSVRFPRVNHLVRAEPTLLLHRGEFMRGAMRHERVTEQELVQAIRGQGIGSPKDVKAVVLETDGGFSIIKTELGDDHSTLRDAWSPSEESE